MDLAKGTAGLLRGSGVANALSGLGPRFSLSPKESVLLTPPLSWAGRSGARRAWPTRDSRSWLKWWHFLIIIFSIEVVVREDRAVGIAGLLFVVEALGVLFVVQHVFVVFA